MIQLYISVQIDRVISLPLRFVSGYQLISNVQYVSVPELSII